MDSTMPSGAVSKMVGGLVQSHLMNTIVNDGKVAKLNSAYVLPQFIDGETLTRRSNAETTRQMV